jgi:hypothetical protein
MRSSSFADTPFGADDFVRFAGEASGTGVLDAWGRESFAPSPAPVGVAARGVAETAAAPG